MLSEPAILIMVFSLTSTGEQAKVAAIAAFREAE
jgi:hypothetical protein